MIALRAAAGVSAVCLFSNGFAHADPTLVLGEHEYFTMPGLDVMSFQDTYPEGHQGGVSIIQNGVRVATNGDVRLEATPGQWQPVPKLERRDVNRRENTIAVTLSYPDPEKDRKGFNPIEYPDLKLRYIVKVKAERGSVHITVDLDRPLPVEWVGKVGFNLELFPVSLFGKAWILDDASGIFPRQPNGPHKATSAGEPAAIPYAIGKHLVIAPEVDSQRMVIESQRAPLELLDGRVVNQNGWFVVRSVVPGGATQGAIDWTVAPNALHGWKYKPVIHVSQVGYHPAQNKTAVIELDPSDKALRNATLVRISEVGKREKVLSALPKTEDTFLRYRYAKFDFSVVKREGVYQVEYGVSHTEPFRIARDLYRRHVWQPTLEYFLPVQMCHMRVTDAYRVWHGLCHMDDALMAPISSLHFDGYAQGPKTLTKFASLEPVPDMNSGGWHDAGDDDLRVESQVGEAYILTLAHESFAVDFDATTIDQKLHAVELHRPDGKPDILQQIEHGMLNVVGAYKSLGRLYRGVISPTLRQYILTGDVANQTDNLVYDRHLKSNERTATRSGRGDDRRVFTEDNPARELTAAAGIAAASRALRGYNDGLSKECLDIAEKLWKAHATVAAVALDSKIHAATELYLTTRALEYQTFLKSHSTDIARDIKNLGWVVGRALPLIHDAPLTTQVNAAVELYARELETMSRRNPFGVPYEPVIWGAGWNIQKFGVEQYFLHKSFPQSIGTEAMYHALEFVLGCHPGENTASFASGVGSRSMTTAYGYNRADYGYIPGGVVSGTALIRPDFPELKDFPYLWQQAEYVLGGGSSNFMFLVLAANQLLSQ